MISRSILTTLAYSDHFSFPLTDQEIHLRLNSSGPCSLERVIGTLRLMLKNHLIQKTGEYYHLPGRKHLVPTRLQRVKLSKLQLSKAKNLTNKISRIPGILAIYLTGSLAVLNSDGDSDIDLMIITKNHRLWTTRLLLTIYTEFLGLRRRPLSGHTSDKLCLNLYLTPSSFSIPSSKQSLYTAYELIQAVPLYDPSLTHSALLAANSWISTYLPNTISRSDLPPRSDLLGRSDLFGYIELFLYWLQKTYMRPRLTCEYITPDSAFFHPHDPSPKV